MISRRLGTQNRAGPAVDVVGFLGSAVDFAMVTVAATVVAVVSPTAPDMSMAAIAPTDNVVVSTTAPDMGVSAVDAIVTNGGMPWFSTPTIWLEANRGVTHTTTVSAWADYSSNAHNVAQANGAKQPAYDATGGPTSGPCITGVAANLTRLVGSWTQAQPVHAFMVIKKGAATDGMTILDGGDGNVNHCRLYYSGGIYVMYSGAQLNGGSAAAGWHVHECVFNSASSDQLEDGASSGTGDVGSNAAGGVCLFSRGDDGGGYSDNSIVELIEFGTVQSAGNAAAIRAYLKAKWGTP